ncbi:MAG TPA: cytochrome P450 [Acidimicrobiales bacterium]|nr:cytochrome P450 [Acidimicrobiales bacterium]
MPVAESVFLNEGGFDPSKPELIADPYSTYRYLQENDPVHWSEAMGGWLITRYDDVRKVLRDPQTFSSERVTTYFGQLPQEFQTMASVLSSWLVFLDPPDHARVRSLGAKAFTDIVLQELQPRLGRIISETITPLIDKGQFDALHDLGYPLAIRVTSELLGVSPEDVAQVDEWEVKVSQFIMGVFMENKEETARIHTEYLVEYFTKLAHDRRLSPRADMLSALVAENENEEQDRLSAMEVISVATQILTAGRDTSALWIANGIYSLLEFPEQRHMLWDQPDMVPSGIEELLRFLGPVELLARIVRNETTIGDITLHPNDRVYLSVGAANRDPRIFDQADEVVVTRNPIRHVAFGWGPHFCIGAGLARSEVRQVFEQLIAGTSEIRPMFDAVEFKPNFSARCVTQLPIEVVAR